MEMRAHDIDYQILGHDLQLVEVELDPGETVIAEAGAMTYLEQEISFETKMGDGSNPDQGIFGKLFSAGKRMITGESLFTTHFTHSGSAGKRKVAFSAPFPGSVIPLNLAALGGKVICQKDAFLCAALGTKLGIAFTKKLGSGLFGGEGFILQSLEGDGTAFIQAGGTVVEKQLNGETLRVDTGCLVGFTEGIDYSIEMSGGLKSMLFGGEGIFLATLSGSGTVWIQSLPFSRMADRILEHAPQGGGSEQGED
ncbi:TIGR00266 family protein [Candidatus Endoriftia persephone]|nr:MULTISPECIES: TIGR00266 family protein [sulfur-oxidizing symbionts]USF89269.1 TIGR00266 family protein [Candidatus Endoriftia persephone]